MKKLAKFWGKLPDKKVRCSLCPWRCVIAPSKLGICRSRKNEGGELYTLVYGSIVSMAADPIEKKPLYHFWPGSDVFSIAAPGCNFKCLHCLDGQTMFPVMIDGRVKIISAKDLDNFFVQGHLVDVSNKNLYALGQNGWRKILKIQRKSSGDEVLEIRTKRGKKIFLTGEHGVMICGSKVIEKKASELSIGDKPLCNFSAVKNGIQKLNLINEMISTVPKRHLKNVYVRNLRSIFKKLKESKKCTFIQISKETGIEHHPQRYSAGIAPIEDFSKIARKFALGDLDLEGVKIGARGTPYTLPAILEITPEVMLLLGSFVGDGNYRKERELVITASKDCQKALRERIGYFDTYSYTTVWKNKSPQISFGGKPWYLLFRFVFGIPAGAPNKRIPWVVFNVEERLLKKFLSAYLSCDGTIGRHLTQVTKSKRSIFIRFITTSRKLTTDLAYLLRTFDIDFSIAEHVPHVTLPTGHRSKLVQYWINIYGRTNIGKLQRIAQFLDKRQKIVDLYLNNVKAIDLKGSDSISGIKRIRPSHAYVYDIILEGDDKDWRNHTFFAGDGILVHNCQNWTISQVKVEEIAHEDLSPERAIELTKRYGCKGIAHTYSEPTIWMEYAYDVGKLAHREDLYNVYVTNGYMTLDALEEFSPYLDAANVDIKAFNDNFYRKICGVPRINPVLETCEWMVEHGIHLEVTYLVIPRENDSSEEIRKFCKWVFEKLGPEVPTHFSRFYPHYKMTDRPQTPVGALERAVKIAKEEGLHHVYIGNVPGHESDNTYCPKCGELLIERYGFSVTRYKLKNKRCPRCEAEIKIVGEYKPAAQP